jgi:hypothetical protein
MTRERRRPKAHIYPHPIQRRTRLIASITGTENARSAQSHPHRGFGGLKRQGSRLSFAGRIQWSCGQARMAPAGVEA